MSDDRERLPAALRGRIPDDVYVTVVYPGDEPPTFRITPDDLHALAARQRSEPFTGPTQTVRIEHSPEGGSWTDLATFGPVDR